MVMGCFTLDKTRSEEREDEGHEINLDLLKSLIPRVVNGKRK